MLFVTPYYLADAYLRLAYLQLGREESNLNHLIKKAREHLATATEALEKNYTEEYQQKGFARVARLQGVSHRLEGDGLAAAQSSHEAIERMRRVLGKEPEKLAYFEHKVTASTGCKKPTLFFNSASPAPS